MIFTTATGFFDHFEDMLWEVKLTEDYRTPVTSLYPRDNQPTSEETYVGLLMKVSRGPVLLAGQWWVMFALRFKWTWVDLFIPTIDTVRLNAILQRCIYDTTHHGPTHRPTQLLYHARGILLDIASLSASGILAYIYLTLLLHYDQACEWSPQMRKHLLSQSEWRLINESSQLQCAPTVMAQLTDDAFGVCRVFLDRSAAVCPPTSLSFMSIIPWIRSLELLDPIHWLVALPSSILQSVYETLLRWYAHPLILLIPFLWTVTAIMRVIRYYYRRRRYSQ